MRLRNKFILHISGIVVVMMTTVMAVVVSRQTSVLKEQAQKRGIAIAQSVAATCESALLVYQQTDLDQDAAKMVELEDIVFVAIFDIDGNRWAFEAIQDVEDEQVDAPTVVMDSTSQRAAVAQVVERTGAFGTSHMLDVALPVVYQSPNEPTRTIGSVRLGLSLDSIYDEIRIVQMRLAYLWGIALVLGFLSSSVMAKRITRPIETVATGALRYASGDLDHRIEVKVRDEISSLAGNLNHMAVQIGDNLSEIEDLNRNLEAKVIKRTKDLAQANRDLRDTLSQLKEAQAQLVQSEKMASLGQLVAGVAHEINNPLNFIYNGVDPLRQSISDIKELVATLDEADLKDDDRDRVDDLKEEIDYEDTVEILDDLINTIEEGARRATVIVKDLRNFSRLDEADLKTADVHEGLEGTISLLRPKLSERIEIIQEFGEIPRFEFSPAQLNQVFMNLLSNAEQAIEGSGSITVRSRVEDNHAVIEVADTGCGIPEEHRTRLFEPFFTTKDVGDGVGLGLSISFGIVEQHGGSIEIDSVEGKGSTFTVRIPIRELAEEVQDTPDLETPQQDNTDNDRPNADDKAKTREQDHA